MSIQNTNYPNVGSGESGLTHAISDMLHTASTGQNTPIEPLPYRVLEGDDDTVYVVDTRTDVHYAIHIKECTD